MYRYVYDGSFFGLLTVVYYIFNHKQEPYEIIAETNCGSDSLLPTKVIATDASIADQVYRGLVKKNSQQVARDVYSLYLSEQQGCEMLLYEFLKKIGKHGSAYAVNMADPIILQVHKTVRKVHGERHRMLGLLRFRSLKNNILYASMEPDHNIVELIAPHFADRLSEELWVIHDCRRNRAAIYDRTQWTIGDFTGISGELMSSSGIAGVYDELLDEDSRLYETLWKTYFEHIGIAGKKNPQLQRQHMPARYWKHMTEFYLPKK